MRVTLGVPKENVQYERRVSVVPEIIPRLKLMGLNVIVEPGAGESAYFPDSLYAEEGAVIAENREEVFRSADIIVSVQRPSAKDVKNMKNGGILIGILLPERNPDVISAVFQTGVVAFTLERIPRITRAQSMDVLSSQSSVAGYRAALLGAVNSPKLMPMLTTAAGTVKPARVLVIGAGVAGLMAIATARRMGSSVTAYDVRRTAGEDVRSLGAKFLELNIDASGIGGYARELTSEEKEQQQEMLENALLNSEVIITTASVPGRRAPLIITKEQIGRMSPGTVIVDLAADSGGNCELTKLGTTEEYKGVKVIGAANLPAEIPINSSQMFSRNLQAFLELIMKEGAISRTFDDEILAACLLTEHKNAPGEGS